MCGLKMTVSGLHISHRTSMLSFRVLSVASENLDFLAMCSEEFGEQPEN